MSNKQGKQKQPNIFSENWAVVPPKRDAAQHRKVSQYQQFIASKINKKTLKDYLDFCSKIFPNGENSLGIMFNDDIKESRALEFLAAQNYDTLRAKFYLAFPVLYRSIKAHRLNVEISEFEMESMLEDFRRQKNPETVSKEPGIFDSLLSTLESRREKVAMQEVRNLLNEATKQKCDIPLLVKQEFTKASDLGDKINELLGRTQKRISEVDALLEKAEELVVLPDSLDKLQTLRGKIEELMYRSAEFMNNSPKDAKVAAQLLKELKNLNIAFEEVPQWAALGQFNEDLNEMLALYRTIRRPRRGSGDHIEKVSFIQYYTLVNFLIDHQIMEQDKINELIDHVNEKIKLKESCQMYLEDDRNREQSSLIPIVSELSECALDFSKVCARVVDKIETLKTLELLAMNIDNEKELFNNQELISAYKRRGFQFYRAEIAYYEKIICTLSRIDDIVVEMNSVELSIEQFLFEDIKLPSYNELKGLLELDYMRDRSANNYLQNMKNFIESYTLKLDEHYRRQEWTIQELYEAVHELVAYILQDDIKLPFLKNKFLRALVVEFELVRFLDKFTNTRFSCTFERWNSRIVENARVFNDIKSGFDYFMENEVIRPLAQISAHYPNLLIVYEQYKSITNFVQDARVDHFSPENVEQLEEMLTGLVNDPVHNTMLESAKQMNNIKVLLGSFERNKSSKYIEHDDMLQNILIISPDSQKSKEFLRRNLGQFIDIYRECQSFNICIDEKDIQEISQYFKRRGTGDAEQLSEYRSSVEEIKDIIETNHRIFRDYQRFVNKEEGSFILKLPLFVIILFKLSSLGIETSYCAEIRVFVKYYLELMDFMDLKNRKTLNEMTDINNRLADFKVYTPVFDQFRALLPFAKAFVEAVAVMETVSKNNMVTSCEVAHNMLKKVKAKDYNVNVTRDGLFLRKRSNALFENGDFREQMNYSVKRVKKAKSNQDAASIEDKLAKPVKKPITKILPIVFNQTEQEFCVCREKYEIIGSGMLRYSKCEEWFHKECLRMSKHRVEKASDEYCMACDFLEGRTSSKLESFIAGKMEESKFMEIFKSYMYLKNYLLDEQIDFIEFVHKKLKRMTEGLDLLINELGNLNDKTRRSRTHNLTLLYLYLPVKIGNIEAALSHIYNITN